MFVNPGAIVGAVAAARAAEEKARQVVAVRALRAEAKNPYADPARLATIATLVPQRARWQTPTWQEVLDAVAGNPNTPPHALIERLQDCAPAVAHNPAFPLLFLEQPDWLNRLNHDVLGALLRLGDAPALAIAALASHPNPGVAHEARHHIAFSSTEADANWQGDIRAHLLALANGMGSAERQLYIEMVELGLAPHWAAGPEPWPEPSDSGRPELMRTIQGGTPEEQAALAEARDTASARALERLARTNSYAVRMSVLENPAATPRALYRACAGRRRVAIGIGELAFFMPWGVSAPLAAGAANHANADALLLWRIAGCASTKARRFARRHPNARQPLTTRRCRRALIQEISRTTLRPFSTRLAGFLLLSDGKTVSGTWRHLAADSFRWTDRLAIALNPQTGKRILRRLAADGHIWVRAASRARLSGEALVWQP